MEDQEVPPIMVLVHSQKKEVQVHHTQEVLEVEELVKVGLKILMVKLDPIFGGPGGDSGNGTSGSGAGNPSGRSQYKGKNGTGGLLTIFSNLINKGIIKTEGASGGVANVNGGCGGGSSGGGSLNIFYKNVYDNEGEISTNGGIAAYGKFQNGGAGGNGSITIGSIATGTFVKDE